MYWFTFKLHKTDLSSCEYISTIRGTLNNFGLLWIWVHKNLRLSFSCFKEITRKRLFDQPTRSKRGNRDLKKFYRMYQKLIACKKNSFSLAVYFFYSSEQQTKTSLYKKNKIVMCRKINDNAKKKRPKWCPGRCNLILVEKSKLVWVWMMLGSTSRNIFTQT